MFGVPFGVFSVNQMEASAKWYDRFNPIPEESMSKIESIVDQIYTIFEWFKNIKENIISMSIDLLLWVYETLTKVILHTPSFLFSSEWFKNNTVTFTGLSISMVIVLSMVEGIKTMSGDLLNRSKKTEIKRLLKRFPIALIASALMPTAFYYGFKGLNKLTDIIVDFGSANVSNGLSNVQINDISLLQVLGFIGFDIALITMLIPVLFQSFRRWFDISVLGIISPLVLTCWMFKSYDHLISMWWNHLKKCSMTQLIYAVFLLIIGTLLFGTNLSNDPLEVFIQLGVLIGGLARMQSPPSIVSRNIDKGGDIKTMFSGASKIIKPFALKKMAAKKVTRGVLGK